MLQFDNFFKYNKKKLLRFSSDSSLSWMTKDFKPKKITILDEGNEF